MKVYICVFLASVALSRAQVDFDGTQPCYDTEVDGVTGWCEHEDCCAYDYVVSDLCPNYPANVKCCYSHNTCATTWGCDQIECPEEAARVACEILEMYEANQIDLQAYHDNFQGNLPSDGASALSNVRDACYGRAAVMSDYETAPGGCVCLKQEMLEYMRDYAQFYYGQVGLPIFVTALAGGSHSATSWHYEGNTADIACKDPTDHCVQLEDFCRSRDYVEVCYPGSTCGGHETWVHCALFYPGAFGRAEDGEVGEKID